MKKIEILEAYSLINEAKLSKLDTGAKIKIIKICKEMKPIVESLQDFEKDARKKLEGDNHKEIVELVQKWQEEGENTTLTIDERKTINKYFTDYNNRVNRCLKEEMDAIVELNFEKLSDSELEKFIDSNDWTVNQAIIATSILQNN